MSVTDVFKCVSIHCLVCFFETGFLCVALEPVLELALVLEQSGLEFTEISLPLTSKCWD
ncbi:hypothetical protein ACRRTK_008565 [Alexandromys fortis]